MKRLAAILLVVALTGCSAVADFAASKLMGTDSGGINTELVVGDKEQTLGNNIEVKADNVGKVVGENDNTTNARGAEFVEVNNFSYPSWVVPVLLTLALVFLALPMPGRWPGMVSNLIAKFKRNRPDD